MNKTISQEFAPLERCASEYGERAWRLAYSLMRNRADAEDVMQQAYLVAVKKMAKVPSRDPWPWFATIITYEAKNARRRRAKLAHAGEEKLMNKRDDFAKDPSLQLVQAELALEMRLQRLVRTMGKGRTRRYGGGRTGFALHLNLSPASSPMPIGVSMFKEIMPVVHRRAGPRALRRYRCSH